MQNQCVTNEDLNSQLRDCKKCGARKPLGDFRKQRLCKFGVGHVCKDCSNSYSKMMSNRVPLEEIKNASLEKWEDVLTAGGKVCKYCGEWKPLKKLCVSVRSIGGHSNICHSCKRERLNAKGFVRKYVPRAMTPEQKELRLARIKRHKVKRRSLFSQGTENTLTAKEWRLLKEMYCHCCAYCGRSGIRLTQDHIVPVTKGGSHTIDNVVPACGSCNSGKNNYDLVVFLARRRMIYAN